MNHAGIMEGSGRVGGRVGGRWRVVEGGWGGGGRREGGGVIA